MPNIYIIIAVVGLALFAYWVLTKQNKVKAFIPKDVKKETKSRFKKEYKFYGQSLGKQIYDHGEIEYSQRMHRKPIPLAFVIGYMKVVENKQLRMLVPLYSKFTKDEYAEMHERLSKQVYNKEYKDLDALEKKQIDKASTEQLRQEKVEVSASAEKGKIIHGKQEVIDYEPIPCYALKVCGDDFFSKILARYLGFGINWWVLNMDQIDLSQDTIAFSANFQRRILNDIFIFSTAARSYVEDISATMQRESQLQEDANFLDRLVHYEGETAKIIAQKREDAKILNEQRKVQKE